MTFFGHAKLQCAAAVVVLVATTCVWAQVGPIGASRDFGNPSLVSDHNMNTSGGWQIGSDGDPADVILDPNAGPWIKNLHNANGGPVSADDTGFTAPQSYSLVEWIHIAGQRSWTDFHEEVITPGWNIGGLMQISQGGELLPVPGLNVMLMDTVWPERGGAVWFTFDPLPPSTVLKLSKTLSWVGNPGVQGDLFNGVIQLAQYPTPEPASIALVALAAIGLVGCRRRSRS
jgi:hypothetical protein